jgi:hypothetical protein
MNCTICRNEIDGEIRREDFLIMEELYPQESMRTSLGDVHCCRDCANKERTRVKVEKYKPFVEAIFRKVNRSSITQNDLDAMVELLNHEHRYLQNEFIMLVQRFLFAYGENSGDTRYEDARNKWALAWAQSAAKAEATS